MTPAVRALTAAHPVLAGLPVCPVRGLPIPHSSGRGADGTARFGVNDPAAKLACALAGRCGLCGLPLPGGEDGDGMVFLAADGGGDPARLLFTDPAMHPACAAAAMAACPFIAGGRAAKPGWLQVVTGGYDLAPGRGAVLFAFRPARPLLAVRRFAYGAGGKLAEVPAGGH